LETTAHAHTTELKNSIILKNIKSNSAPLTPNELKAVTTETCALLLTLQMKLLLTYSSYSSKMQIFICSILRRCGAHIQIHTTREITVSMPTIGKISEESNTCTLMKKINAPLGKPKTLFKPTQMDANKNIGASTPTAGKNLSITLFTTKSMHADNQKIAKNPIAPTIIIILIEDTQSINSSKYFLKTEELLPNKHKSIKEYF